MIVTHENITPIMEVQEALQTSEAELSREREIEVANMVRSGKPSKEIAGVLNLSVSGVDFHRKSLRKKLGLTHTARNLRSHLLSLE